MKVIAQQSNGGPLVDSIAYKLSPVLKSVFEPILPVTVKAIKPSGVRQPLVESVIIGNYVMIANGMTSNNIDVSSRY